MSQSVTTPPPDMSAYVTRGKLRADLAKLGLDFRTALHGVGSEVGGLRGEIADLRVSIADGRAEAARDSIAQTRWLIGTIVATGALIVAALKLLPPH